MRKTIWQNFFEESTFQVLGAGKDVLDVGGGLRIDKSKNNRLDKNNYDLFHEKIKSTNYKVMDPVPDFNPDFVGDIHKMPFEDGKFDSIICLAVLEHVEDPIRAVAECKRVLKKGGKAVFYVPFLFYYHAEKGYYKDYWRFTKDTCDYLFSDMSVYQISPVRSRFGTLGLLTGVKLLEKVGNLLDMVIPRKTSQVSGYYIYIQK